MKGGCVVGGGNECVWCDGDWGIGVGDWGELVGDWGGGGECGGVRDVRDVGVFVGGEAVVFGGWCFGGGVFGV